MTHVCAVILTWNRKDLLARCLAAIAAQSRPPDRVVVVDNASTDGTAEMLAAQGWAARLPLVHQVLPGNLGASGGFSACFKVAAECGADYAWIMDDDVIPDPGALAGLLHAAATLDEPFSYLASRVLGPDGASMNVPEPDTRGSDDRYPDWDRRLDDGLVKIRRSTFVSILVPRETLAHISPPSADFVMWGEDADWTLRATSWRPAWIVGGSRVVHARASYGPPDSPNEADPARVGRLFYLYRNEVYIASRHYGIGAVVRVVAGNLRRAVLELTQRPVRWNRIGVVLRGLAAGMRFKPRDL
ncbi:MAG TPA: glycosyltransferase [Azospirillaceae bacterium]|nr:glycosyltransferase [Azospirillaceae bacterium]